MKKLGYLVLAGACALAIALAGCSGGTASSSSAESESSAAESSSTAITGGWAFTPLDEINLDADAQKVFKSATADSDAGKYTPVAVLATQVVSGTNYAFLCQTDANAWDIVAVYQDLQGKDSVMSDKAIDIAEVKADSLDRAGGDEELVGAWEVVMPEAPAVLPEDAWVAFDTAFESYANDKGLDLIPVASLGSQLVSGTNYRILCAGQESASKPATSLYVVDVYAPLQGDPEFTSVNYFDLLSYIDQ